MISLFTAEEVRRMIKMHYSSIYAALPESASAQDTAWSAIGLLSRNRLIDDDFFSLMTELRPRMHAEIAAFAGTWKSSIASERAPSRSVARGDETQIGYLHFTIVACSIAIPVAAGISAGGMPYFTIVVAGAFLVGPVACLALVLKRTVAFTGSLFAGIRLLDKSSIFTLATTVTGSALATGGVVVGNDIEHTNYAAPEKTEERPIVIDAKRRPGKVVRHIEEQEDAIVLTEEQGAKEDVGSRPSAQGRQYEIARKSEVLANGDAHARVRSAAKQACRHLADGGEKIEITVFIIAEPSGPRPPTINDGGNKRLAQCLADELMSRLTPELILGLHTFTFQDFSRSPSRRPNPSPE